MLLRLWVPGGIVTPIWENSLGFSWLYVPSMFSFSCKGGRFLPLVNMSDPVTSQETERLGWGSALIPPVNNSFHTCAPRQWTLLDLFLCLCTKMKYPNTFTSVFVDRQISNSWWRRGTETPVDQRRWYHHMGQPEPWQTPTPFKIIVPSSRTHFSTREISHTWQESLHFTLLWGDFIFVF